MRRAGRGSRWLSGSRWLTVTVGLLSALALLTGCAGAPVPPVPPPAPPAAPPVPPVAPNQGKQLVVGVDNLGTGFNPHLISDQSPVCTEVASLVLPSVFRPDATGALHLDTTVATSATVTSTAPFTVSYELNLAASWSDNAPIAAEDFVYLWQRMRSEPAVVDNAGYRLITDVRSRAGGKAVDVVFAQTYPQWRRLFSNLLPGHLLKDAPSGFGTGLADSIPVSGGPFQVVSLDRARGQLVLARNDHYWGTPAVLDSLVLRRVDATGALDGLRGGELPVAHLWPDQATLASLKALQPPVRLQGVAQPMVVQLGMRTDRGVLTDVRVRQAIGALLNRDTLISIGTANGSGGVRDDAQLLAPSEPGYRPTAPSGAPLRPDPNLAGQLLTSAGYVRDPQGHWALLGVPLHVTVGAPTDRPRFQAIAAEVVRELGAAGVRAQLVTAPGPALFTEPTVVPSPPTTVTTPSAGIRPSASPSPAASTPPRAGTSLSVAPPAHGAGTHGGPRHPAAGAARPSPARAAPPAPTAAAASSSVNQPVAPQQAPSPGPPTPQPAGVTVDLMVMPRAVGADLVSTAASNYGCPPGMAGVAQPARNSTGFCSPELQPVLDAALSGALSPEVAAPKIESVLWAQLPAIPLFQVVTTLASTPKGDALTGNISPGPLTLGPLATAPTWQPLNQ